MLLHNNTIATAGFLSTTESPSSTTSVYSQTNPPTSSTNQFFQNFPPPWIPQYNNQRLLTQQFFVRILFINLIVLFCSSNIHSYRS
ncbi:unnamed protein product [Rotaria sp. Silwood2]|nr:unnamed protein product [Rotaria sp. Silwood2]CAF2731867.1 unnamed protein product [Rotaria sp. Silwood2]CAF2993584.1 unnamed protein product [Rotaria sp. Silwood2]CAF3145867.1 unnamed protein product [Rotaria sp. Silwood2]